MQQYYVGILLDRLCMIHLSWFLSPLAFRRLFDLLEYIKLSSGKSISPAIVMQIFPTATIIDAKLSNSTVQVCSEFLTIIEEGSKFNYVNKLVPTFASPSRCHNLERREM